MPTKNNGDIDWSKLFMGLAVAIVFVLQAWHGIKLSDLQAQVVPRAEYDKGQNQVMDKDEILDALKMINARMNAMEGTDETK